jgi:hypothetical protein
MIDFTKIILLLITCFVIIFSIIKQRHNNLKKDDLTFLLSSILVTIFLAFIFVIKPHHLLRVKLNISNFVIYIFYFVIICTYLLRYMKILFRSKYFLIIISFTLFGFANAVDLLSDGRIFILIYNEIVEEIFHILGIVFWLLFFVDYLKRMKIKYL